jgi:regulator of replication initiation timing
METERSGLNAVDISNQGMSEDEQIASNNFTDAAAKVESFIGDLSLRQQWEERLQDVQAELADARRNINDLIMEIETVALEESTIRNQNARLLSQVADCQSMQRTALEENLKLQNQIETIKSARVESEAK